MTTNVLDPVPVESVYINKCSRYRTTCMDFIKPAADVSKYGVYTPRNTPETLV